jgi:protein-tyrosine phosphatase
MSGMSSGEPAARIPVPGTFNLRDVGGLPAQAGVVRSGVLFRSDGLHRLGASGRAALAALGVGVVIDLRDTAEVRNQPDDLDGLDVEVRQLPVFEGSTGSHWPDITLDVLYQRIVTQHAGVVVDALREIATARDGAVLVHCTAGKDRTGIVTALALLAVGVESHLVVADYARTEANLAGEWLDGMVELVGRYGVPDAPELRMLMGGSPPEALERVIEHIEGEHGSVREYLLSAGLSLEDLAALETRLVDEG